MMPLRKIECFLIAIALSFQKQKNPGTLAVSGSGTDIAETAAGDTRSSAAVSADIKNVA
jgi:hypothetical protein